MSHRTVNVTNVFIMQPTYTALGLGPIPAGTLPDVLVPAIEKKLVAQLQAAWPSTFPAYTASQQDMGIMGPWADNIAGTAPPCLVQQATLDFQNWELPVDAGAIDAMGKTITQEISSNGGEAGTAFGRTRVGTAVTIYWGVSFVTGPIADNPEEIGVIYVFTALADI
jgi:hypothetical protein